MATPVASVNDSADFIRCDTGLLERAPRNAGMAAACPCGRFASLRMGTASLRAWPRYGMDAALPRARRYDSFGTASTQAYAPRMLVDEIETPEASPPTRGPGG
jgi:hypothetical protein